MTMPSVSIIVPVYKTPLHLLQRFIDSVLSQTLKDFELIAVDDASPDDCPQLLDSAAQNDSRISVIHRKVNGRAGMARGDGLAIARGSYVLFADADDTLRHDMCRTMIELALKTDADIVSCSFTISDMDGRLLDRRQFPEECYELSVPRQRAKAYRRMNYALWNKLFRRKAIESLCFEQFEANIGEDTLFNIGALLRSHKLVTTAYSGYDYAVHSISATKSSSKGFPYLRTLILSGERIRQIVLEADKSRVGRKFLDRLILKRFITGCGWIAEQADNTERTAMWAYWQQYFLQQVLPAIQHNKLLALCCKVGVTLLSVTTSYRWGIIASSLTDPLSFFDKVSARNAAKRLAHPTRVGKK